MFKIIKTDLSSPFLPGSMEFDETDNELLTQYCVTERWTGDLTNGLFTLGEKAAHACTEAVESVIEELYADQIAEIGERDPALAADLTQFRMEELEHHDHAVAHGSREAPAYRLLSAVIKTGCRVAIKISEKV